MNISFVSTILNFPWGGADTLWTNAAERAAARGDRLFLAVSATVAQHPRIRALESAGAVIFVQQPAEPPRTLPARLTRKLRAVLRRPDALLQALDGFRPDLVLFSFGGTYDAILTPTWYDGLAARRIPYRLIANWQVEHPRLAPAELTDIKRIFAAADRLYFVSQRNLSVTREHLGQPLAHAEVVQNPLRWKPEDATPWPEGNGLSLAAVARLEAVKGLQILLPALAGALPPEGWRLQIYGQGPDEAALRRQVQALGLDSRVIFRGYVGSLREIWIDNHLLVSPALEEGVPMTIPEAMLCGRAVLATAVGGAADWVVDGKTGYLCPAPSGPALATTLETAWSRRDRWRELGQAGAARARLCYRPDDCRLLIG